VYPILGVRYFVESKRHRLLTNLHFIIPILGILINLKEPHLEFCVFHYGVHVCESCNVGLVDLNLHLAYKFYYRTIENVSLET
jgi:hypothetical protein